jgi:hypothetical protein
MPRIESWHGACNRATRNQTTTLKNESTYALIVRSESEEKGRGVLETVFYAFFILSALFAIVQFAHQPLNVPAAGYQPSACVTCDAASVVTSTAKS